jgi:hypothetical protein
MLRGHYYIRYGKCRGISIVRTLCRCLRYSRDIEKVSARNFADQGSLRELRRGLQSSTDQEVNRSGGGTILKLNAG